MRKFLKIIGIIVASILAVVFLFVVFVFTRPDIPPIDDSDLTLKLPKVPDSENGYYLMKSILKQKSRGEDRIYYRMVLENKTPTDSESKAIQKRFGKATSQVEKALTYPYIAFPQKEFGKYCDPRNIDVPIFARDLAVSIILSARFDIRNGQKEEALRKMVSAHKYGYAIQSSSPDLLGFAIRRSIALMVEKDLNRMIDNGNLPVEMVAPYARSLEESQPDAIARALKVEYAEVKLLNDGLAEDVIKHDKGFLIFRKSRIHKPNTDISRIHQYYKDYLRFAALPVRSVEIDTYRMPCPGIIDDVFSGNLFPMVFGGRCLLLGVDYFGRFLSINYNSVLKLRALKLKIAALAYRAKYGKLPETLSDLTPQFIEVIPIDPFDGKPLRYDPKKAIIYSVGFNRVDDHGSSSYFMLSDQDRGNLDKWKKEKDFALNILPLAKR